MEKETHEKLKRATLTLKNTWEIQELDVPTLEFKVFAGFLVSLPSKGSKCYISYWDGKWKMTFVIRLVCS